MRAPAVEPSSHEATPLSRRQERPRPCRHLSFGPSHQFGGDSGAEEGASKDRGPSLALLYMTADRSRGGGGAGKDSRD